VFERWVTPREAAEDLAILARRNWPWFPTPIAKAADAISTSAGF